MNDWNAGTPDLLVIHDLDNVATALRDLRGGAVATVTGIHGDSRLLKLNEEIRLGHKAAIACVSKGATIVKHGQPIGRATVDIAEGDHVHVHNLVSLSQLEASDGTSVEVMES